MNKSVALCALAFCFLLIMPNQAFAQRGRNEVINVRLASPLPQNSDWGRALDRIAAEWARVTNNTVRLIVLHGGREGSETMMVSSLKVNNIQAGLFFSEGLTEICPAVMNLSVPFQIRTEEELDTVLKDVLPVLDNRVRTRGTRPEEKFAVVAWAKGGWVNIFSKQEVFVPDQLRQQKLASSIDLKDMNLAFSRMGFSLEEVNFKDIGLKLGNNMVSAIYLTPIAVAPLNLQLTGGLKHMLDLPIAPFLGAIIMNDVTWNKLGPERQQAISRVTQQIADEFDALMSKTVGNAVTSMKRNGLNVNRPSSAQEELWYIEIDKVMPSLVGTTFDRDLYNQVNRILERSRNGQ